MATEGPVDDGGPLTPVRNNPSTDNFITPVKNRDNSAKRKRSLTPRGALFPSLDEAHRRITSRGSHSRKTSAACQTGSLDSYIQVPAVPKLALDGSKEMETAHDLLRLHGESSVPTRCLTGRRVVSDRALGNDPHIAKLPTSSTDVPFKGLPSDAQQMGYASHSDATASTLSRIIGQYAESRSSYANSGSLRSSDPEYELSGGHKRLENTHESTSENQIEHEKVAVEVIADAPVNEIAPHQSKKRSDPSKSFAKQKKFLYTGGQSHSPAKAAKNADDSQRKSSDSSTTPSSLSEEKVLPKTKAQIDTGHIGFIGDIPLLVSPQTQTQANIGDLRMPFGNVQDTESHMGSKDGDSSTGSNQNPFKYDEENYRRILDQSNQERRVSCELRMASGIKHHSAGTLALSEASPTKSQEAMPQKQDLPRMTYVEISKKPGNLETSFFFDPKIMGDSPDTAEYTDSVKVQINKGLPSVPHEDKNEELSSNFGLSIPSRSPRQKHQHDCSPNKLSSEADWITEVTSDAGLGSPSSMYACRDGGIKRAGSSIADYSDDESGFKKLDHMGSRDFILHHPSARSLHGDYGIMKVKDTNKPACIPRPGLKDGFKNSIRLQQNQQNLPNPSVGNRNVDGSANGNMTNAPPSFIKSVQDRLHYGKTPDEDYQKADFNDNFPLPSAEERAKIRYRKDSGDWGPFTVRDSASTQGPAASNKATTGTSDIASRALDVQKEGLVSEHEDQWVNQGHGVMGNKFQRTGQGLPHASEFPRGQVIEMQSFVESNGPMSPNSPSTTRSKGRDSHLTTPPQHFPLVSRKDAASRQKYLRDSGLVDETESSQQRKERASRGSIKIARTPSQLGPSELPHLPTTALLRESERSRGSHRSTALQVSSPGTPTPATGLIAGQTQFTDVPLTSPMPRHHRDLLNARRKRQANLSSPGPSHDALVKLGLVRPGRAANNTDIESARQRRNMQERTRAPGDENMSLQAHNRRKLWFYLMIALSMLPFFALLVLNNKVFDEALSWLTDGEVTQLTRRQRTIIFYMFFAECFVYTALVASIVIYYGANSGAMH